jgi:hypothetical protein
MSKRLGARLSCSIIIVIVVIMLTNAIDHPAYQLGLGAAGGLGYGRRFTAYFRGGCPLWMCRGSFCMGYGSLSLCIRAQVASASSLSR